MRIVRGVSLVQDVTIENFYSFSLRAVKQLFNCWRIFYHFMMFYSVLRSHSSSNITLCRLRLILINSHRGRSLAQTFGSRNWSSIGRIWDVEFTFIVTIPAIIIFCTTTTILTLFGNQVLLRCTENRLLNVHSCPSIWAASHDVPGQFMAFFCYFFRSIMFHNFTHVCIKLRLHWWSIHFDPI